MKKPSKDTASVSIEIRDSTLMQDSLLSVDSLAVSLDSMIAEIPDDSLPPVEENFVLMQDELIYVKNYQPKGDPISFHCDVDPELDSLLIDNKIKIPKDGIRVEFWKSPVNFKGYRLSRFKLVLFGIYDYDSLSFSYFEGKSIKMTYHQKDYILKCSQDFIPLNLKQQR